jgi:hypothetical protein
MSLPLPGDSPATAVTNGVSGKPVFFDPARTSAGRVCACGSDAARPDAVFVAGHARPEHSRQSGTAVAASGQAVSFLPQGAHALPAVPTLAPERPLTRRERALRSDVQNRLARERAARTETMAVAVAQGGPGCPSSNALAIGFFVNWDDASMSSLKQNLDSLDTVIAEWLHLAAEDGSLRENDPTRTRR